MNGLELVPYEVDQGMACPLCGIAHSRFTGISRSRRGSWLAPGIEETIPARILGWALECGCLLPVADWSWITEPGVPTRWVTQNEFTKLMQARAEAEIPPWQGGR